MTTELIQSLRADAQAIREQGGDQMAADSMVEAAKRIEELEAQFADETIFAAHSGKSTHREWHTVGTWLYPGWCIVERYEDAHPKEFDDETAAAQIEALRHEYMTRCADEAALKLFGENEALRNASIKREVQRDRVEEALRERYLLLAAQHTRLCEQVYEEDGETLKIEALEARLHEVRELYTGMDGFIPETAPEAYQQYILGRIYKAAMGKENEK